MTTARPLPLFALLLPLAVGCGTPPGDTPLGADEAGKIALRVSMVNDDKSTPNTLSRHFAKGAVPKDLKKFPKFTYDTPEKPTVTGDTATVKVKMTAELGGKEQPDQTWTLVKEGDEWKIKDAPLP
jgi:hypothetical protein